MMRILFLFLLLSFNLGCKQKQSIDCKEIYNKKPNFLTKSSEPIKSLLAEDIKILKHCGNFTDADSLLFNGPIFGALMVKFFDQRETLTYGRIIAILQAIKNDSAFANLLFLEQLEKAKAKNIEKRFEFKPLISFEEAIADAKKANKKLLIFFTGYARVNGVKMEEEVLVDQVVKNTLAMDFVCFKAYVDDRTELPISDQYLSKVMKRKLSSPTMGSKFNN